MAALADMRFNFITSLCDEKKCPYSKIDNKNNIYIQERTKWTDILRVHIGRPFFRFTPHDRKKEKVKSFCS